METVIKLDQRRRTSLAKVGRSEHHEYAVYEREDGSLLLTPVVLMPADLEARLLADPAIRKALEESQSVRKEDLIPYRGPGGIRERLVKSIAEREREEAAAMGTGAMATEAVSDDREPSARNTARGTVKSPSKKAAAPRTKSSSAKSPS